MKSKLSQIQALLPVYLALFGLLLPIVYLALWGVRNARPANVQNWFVKSGDQNFLMGFMEYPVNRNGQMYLCTNLETETYSSSKIENGRLVIGGFCGTTLWTMNDQGKDKFSVHVRDLWNTSESEMREFEFANHSTAIQSLCVIDGHYVRRNTETIDSFDFRNGLLIDSISYNPSTSTFEQFNGTNRFLVIEKLGAMNLSSSKHELFGLKEGKFNPIASWQALSTCQFTANQMHFIASLLEDGATIEVRNAVDGKIVSSYPVPRHPLLVTPLASLNGTVYENVLLWTAAPTLSTNLLTGETLPIPAGLVPMAHDVAGKRLMALGVNYKGRMGLTCQVLDSATGDELNSFSIESTHPVLFPYRGNRNQLAVANHFHQVLVYDLTSGKLVRRIDPFRWMIWTDTIAEIAFYVWCFAWLRCSVRLHQQGWLDWAICSGVVAAYCCFRVRSTGAPEFFFTSSGLFGGWILASLSWLILGKTRWSVRIQPLLLVCGIVVGMAVVSKLDDRFLGTVLVGMALLTGMFSVVLIAMRYFRIEFGLKEGTDLSLRQPATTMPSRVALQDLFLLTIVFAILFSVARWIVFKPGLRIDFKQIASTLIIDCILAVPCLLAMWTALSTRSAVARWSVWIVLLLMALVQQLTGALGGFPLFPGAVPASIAALFGFHAYRLRGWRFCKAVA